jgi:hypothetical protein
MNVAIDIDGVLANFIQHMIEYAHEKGYHEFPAHWTQWHQYNIPGLDQRFGKLVDEVSGDPEWWLDIPPHDDAYLSAAPDLYLTSRNVGSQYTLMWLLYHGFPHAEVVTVDSGEDKPPKMKERGIDVLLDNRFDTYESVNKQKDLKCVLMERPHNRRLRDDFDITVSDTYEFEQMYL